MVCQPILLQVISVDYKPKFLMNIIEQDMSNVTNTPIKQVTVGAVVPVTTKKTELNIKKLKTFFSETKSRLNTK